MQPRYFECRANLACGNLQCAQDDTMLSDVVVKGRRLLHLQSRTQYMSALPMDQMPLHQALGHLNRS